MKNRICKISLFSAILACVANMPADAVVKTKNSNRSYANAYNQVAAIQQQQAYYDATATTATTASSVANLPVMVDDKNLAEAIANNTSETVNISDLEACSMIYPNGVFKWGIPESGVRQNPTSQCVAVVELRDANTNAVLATTTLAAGDSMKCNADMFPQSGLLPAIEKVEVPNDNPPTMEDVEKVMNEEQKQNAGIKIAAAAIISGVAGNMLAPKNAGDTRLMGTSKTQLMDTAIGMTAGAGIMAASTYSGKVAGDTIKSTAVNAAAGMVVGNMAAGMTSGNSVLSIRKCTIGESKDEKDCVVGNLATLGETISYSSDATSIYIINKSGSTYKCTVKTATNNGVTSPTGDLSGCVSVRKPLHIQILGKNGDIDYDKNVAEWDSLDVSEVYQQGEGTTKEFKSASSTQGNFVVISSADMVSSTVRAYAIMNNSVPHKAFGYKLSDFGKDSNLTSYVVYSRKSDGTAGKVLYDPRGTATETKEKEGETESTEEKTEEKFEFTPIEKDASDGNLIDINNEARAKATLIGTAAGGALGGMAGYQGAKTELEQRWVEAVRTYNDSLSNFVCMTGGRFLAKYNDFAEIPAVKKD